MTNVVALELEVAVSILHSEGYTVETVETRSKKGVPGSDARRVIRQLELTDRETPCVQLVFAEFKTSADA